MSVFEFRHVAPFGHSHANPIRPLTWVDFHSAIVKRSTEAHFDLVLS